MDLRRAVRERSTAVRNRRQRVVIDSNEGGRVLGNVAVVGDNDRHRLADVDDLVPGQCGTVPLLLVTLAGKTDDEPLDPQVRHQIAQRKNSVHAGIRQRRSLVDAADRGMTVRTAHECGLQHARQPDVVDEAPQAPQQIVIFEPANAFAADFCVHCRRSFPARRRCAASSAAATMP